MAAHYKGTYNEAYSGYKPHYKPIISSAGMACAAARLARTCRLGSRASDWRTRLERAAEGALFEGLSDNGLSERL